MEKGQDIYGSKKLVLPKPEIYVIYTGSRKARPKTISFAKEFFPDEDCCLDVAVHMIYDGEKGDIINQYVFLLLQFLYLRPFKHIHKNFYDTFTTPL